MNTPAAHQSFVFRMITESENLELRCEKLARALQSHRNGYLHLDDFDLMTEQLVHMRRYSFILESRIKKHTSVE